MFFLYRAEYYGLTEDEDGESTLGAIDLIIAKNDWGNYQKIRYHFESDYGKVLPLDMRSNSHQKVTLNEFKDQLAPDKVDLMNKLMDDFNADKDF